MHSKFSSDYEKEILKSVLNFRGNHKTKKHKLEPAIN